MLPIIRLATGVAALVFVLSSFLCDMLLDVRFISNALITCGLGCFILFCLLLFVNNDNS
jgi:hypothetical protein